MHPRTEKVRQQWGEDLDPKLIEILDKAFSVDPGPTGQYPEGKLNSHDDGALMIQFSGDPVSQTVIMKFGTMASWIGFPVNDIDRLCATLQKCKTELSKTAN